MYMHTQLHLSIQTPLGYTHEQSGREKQSGALLLEKSSWGTKTNRTVVGNET